MWTVCSKRSGDRVLTASDYMARALALAGRGRGRTSPNPLVGAVVVSPDGVIEGQGFHERAGEPHAEVHALAMAGVRARGATLYCTLEPCCHVGRTGPCVERIVEAGISRVVASIEDPNPKVSGRGFAFLRDHGIDVEIGLGASQAARLNQPFLTLIRERRPFVILKAATSVDGFIAASAGQRTKLTSAAADRHAHAARAEVDAIGVGSGTVLVDDPLLTARGVFRERPLTRVIFDRRLQTPPSARVLSTGEAGPVIIVTTAEAADRRDLREPLEARAALIEVAGDGSLRAALERLAGLGVGSLLLEGGAALHASAWREGVVDFVRLYVTPHGLGPSGVPLLDAQAWSPMQLIDPRVEPIGPDTLIEGYVHRPR
jgi:diaminohydroxyphosphoribosylaminopyrimidine deaminase/5-amino-6-(5-phosphoribosylamino)uracil reductase